MITYKDSGVNIEEGYKTVKKISEYAKQTHSKEVVNDIGSFAGCFSLENYENPILVSGTDGVGTKLELALKAKKYENIGIDCVAMCVNDILCLGAKPLFFLDYLACGKLSAEVASEIVKGVSLGCLEAKCSLIGGETAEMPGFYDDGKYDIAGFCVGVVSKNKIINGDNISAGDVLIGLESSGLHSNGFSLVRKLIKKTSEKLNGVELSEILLKPTKIYVKAILKLLESYEIKGMAHITGGGFVENIPRMFRQNLRIVIEKNSYKIPEIFEYLMDLGVSEEEMYKTFNMGIGLVLAVDKNITCKVIESLANLGEAGHIIGYFEEGEKSICIK